MFFFFLILRSSICFGVCCSVNFTDSEILYNIDSGLAEVCLWDLLAALKTH